MKNVETFSELRARLRPQAAAFVDAYLFDHNATKAAKVAGYSPRTAHARGWKLLRQRAVSAAIDAGKRERVAAPRRLEQLLEIAANPRRRRASGTITTMKDIERIIAIEDAGGVYMPPVTHTRVRRRQRGKLQPPTT